MRISKDRYYLVEAPKRSKANKPVVGFSGQARRRNTQFLVEYYALVMLMDRDRGCEGMIAFKLKDGAPKRTEVDASDVHSTPLQTILEMYTFTEISLHVRCLLQMVIENINRWDVGIGKEWFGNILIVGGTTSMQHLKEQLEKYLLVEFPQAARVKIAFYHKDITKLQVEVTTGTIAEIEAIVVREDMQVAFEDVVDEFTLKKKNTTFLIHGNDSFEFYDVESTKLVNVAIVKATIKGTKVVTTTDLAQKVVINEIAESMMPFNTNYKDTRSFGVYIAAKLNWLDHLSYAIMYEITKLEAHCLSAADVICARNQLMSPLMLHIDGSSPAEEDFGHQ
ncbi:hypothetical protein V6N13_032337 [Hibiscus sabdariffa]